MHDSAYAKPVALLWDIDGTLLRAQAAVTAWCTAARMEFDFNLDWNTLDTAGATDILIAWQICAQAGQQPASAERLIARYLQLLPARLQADPARLLPNVESTLAFVEEHPGYGNFLLTGNVKAAAYAKFHSGGLGRFCWEGAFSEHGPERERVAAAAKQLACTQHQAPISLVVIGDTPRDIHAARAIGARILALATGKYSLKDLAEHEPDELLAHLPDCNDFADVIAELVR